mmetsp:Transcript_2312/g.5737  ORF Transcript_2312/g.5737 Transcript_2312/m.5737 type:complete len:116 (-) Transcript_2312:117-464(-)
MILPHQPRTIPAAPAHPWWTTLPPADTKEGFDEQFPAGRVFDDMSAATEEAAHKLSHAFGFTVARSGYKIMCSRGVPPRRSRRRSFHGGIWLGKMTTLVQRNLGSLLIVTQSFPL